MYKRILVPLEHSSYDDVIVAHVRKLAQTCGSSLVLIHVADGWAARNIKQLNLRESEEMKKDRAYIEGIAESLEGEGFEVDAILAGGTRGRKSPTPPIARSAISSR
jgi:Universal stress protein family.